MDGNVQPVLETLKGKLTSIVIPEIDATLTKEGYCADAKAVGDALGGLAALEELPNMKENINKVQEDMAGLSEEVDSVSLSVSQMKNIVVEETITEGEVSLHPEGTIAFSKN